MYQIICVVGARPNFMKIAPIIEALKQTEGYLMPFLVHTGQHYDQAMKASFFEQLGIPEPDIDLNVGSGSHAWQTAQIMIQFEQVLDQQQPQAVLVVGDVNSTIACALVAVKKHIPVVHVEAGLRSFDRQMPEEINRVLTDQISSLLLTTEAHAKQHLLQEGIQSDAIHFVGNVMIDTLLKNQQRCPSLTDINQGYQLNLSSGHYGLLTLHRPSNVDHSDVLADLFTTMISISEKLPLVFPVHPRTQAKLSAGFCQSENIFMLPPVAYLDMLALMSSAKLVLTDSGGIQEETTALGIPCVTLRENTERPITVTEGTNTIVGTDSQKILATVADILSTGGKQGQIPKYWDGHAAERIVAVLKDWISQ